MQTKSELLVTAIEAVRNERRRRTYELRLAAWRYAQGLGFSERPTAVVLQMKGGVHVKAA